MSLLQTTYNTAQKLVDSFVALGILQQNEGLRNKSFTFRRYLDILENEFVGNVGHLPGDKTF